MPKENETVTVGVLREMLAENNVTLMKGIDKRFDHVDARFAQVDARFDRVDARFEQVDARFDGLESKMDTEFARVHREIANLRDDVVDVLDRSIVPQLEDHRRDIALLKRAVTMG